MISYNIFSNNKNNNKSEIFSKIDTNNQIKTFRNIFLDINKLINVGFKNFDSKLNNILYTYLFYFFLAMRDL